MHVQAVKIHVTCQKVDVRKKIGKCKSLQASNILENWRKFAKICGEQKKIRYQKTSDVLTSFKSEKIKFYDRSPNGKNSELIEKSQKKSVFYQNSVLKRNPIMSDENY